MYISVHAQTLTFHPGEWAFPSRMTTWDDSEPFKSSKQTFKTFTGKSSNLKKPKWHNMAAFFPVGDNKEVRGQLFLLNHLNSHHGSSLPSPHVASPLSQRPHCADGKWVRQAQRRGDRNPGTHTAGLSLLRQHAELQSHTHTHALREEAAQCIREINRPEE